MDLVEVGSRTMQVRCIYVGYWKHETHNSQKNAEKTGRLYTECTRRYEPVKLAIANDIPFIAGETL